MEVRPLKVLCVVGARPNFMKIAPIMRAFNNDEYQIEASLVHTGQHYDASMKHAFFQQLNIPEPDIDLEVGSGSHAVQTAQIMMRFESVLDSTTPDAVLVVGDVNSTIACALVAVKKDVPVIHVEAGLRSNDRAMPEEINRVLTDQISDLLFTTEKNAQANLVREGIELDRIHFVGNVMIDTLVDNLDRAVPAAETIRDVAGADSEIDFTQGYAVVTLHRPSNVDNPELFGQILDVLDQISDSIPIIFPVHPRTRQRITDLGLDPARDFKAIVPAPPLGYHQMLGLMRDARLVLTDSGGIQEETTALGVPCLTLRENTERPITVEQGTNTVVGVDSKRIYQSAKKILETGGKQGRIPEYWDGKASERIAEIIQRWWAARQG